MTDRKPRAPIMCCICEKVIKENPSQARKRFNRENQDQVCSNPCRDEYRRRVGAASRARAFNAITARALEQQ